MKKLIPFEENYKKVYKSIAENSRKPKKEKLLGELDTIFERYELYYTNRKNLTNIEQIDYSEREDLKNHLLSCYSENTTLNNLKADIIKKQELFYQAKCPYCGLNSHGSFDHYLPKEDFPDFSVLAINLIPCCEKCNSKKGRKWKDDEGKRLFINFYYDFLPQEKYLFANISLTETNTPIVSYEIQRNEAINTEIFEIVDSHYSKLNLCSRFEAHANDEISNIFQETQLAAQEGIQKELQIQTLRRKLKIISERYGRNNWLVALYEAIVESDFFNRCYG